MAEHDAAACTDLMNGGYACAFPMPWVSSSSEVDFLISAGGEEFEPIRTKVDPMTGDESTVATYPRPAVVVAPVACIEDHSFASADGSRCVCEERCYRRVRRRTCRTR